MLRTVRAQDNPETIIFPADATTASDRAFLSAKAITPHPALGPPGTALKTMALLQTTLEIEPLIRLFSRETCAKVAHSGLTYQNRELEFDFTIGRAAKHTLSFQLVVKQQLLGTLIFSRGKPFLRKDAAALEQLLGCVIYPLRNAVDYQVLFQASLLDPLTGVFNRNVMKSALEREAGLARRNHEPLSFIILDIDGFKGINDQYGHQAGDQLIQSVADTISNCIRSTDLLSRYGGDEFTVLLSNTGKQGAARVAEQIRQAIDHSECIIDDTAIRATVSLGVAILNSRNRFIDLFAAADEALMQAKQAGRDRVIIAA